MAKVRVKTVETPGAGDKKNEEKKDEDELVEAEVLLGVSAREVFWMEAATRDSFAAFLSSLCQSWQKGHKAKDERAKKAIETEVQLVLNTVIRVGTGDATREWTPTTGASGIFTDTTVRSDFAGRETLLVKQLEDASGIFHVRPQSFALSFGDGNLFPVPSKTANSSDFQAIYGGARPFCALVEKREGYFKLFVPVGGLTVESFGKIYVPAPTSIKFADRNKRRPPWRSQRTFLHGCPKLVVDGGGGMQRNDANFVTPTLGPIAFNSREFGGQGRVYK